MARARRTFPSRGNRRIPTWVGPADQSYVSVGSGLSVLIASFAPEDASIVKPTVVRVRGQVSIKLNSYAADLDIAGAFGMCVVSDEAFVAGAASIPRPFDDADWDGWFVWRSFAAHYELLDATGAFLASYEFEVDSKAMRKVTSNETIVMMCESQTGAVQISMGLRTLLLLS